MSIRRLFAIAALLLAAVVAIPPVRAADAPCEFENVGRIVAVGDVHGAYDQFLDILRAADVVNARGRWSGGRTHLVQVGDVLDRGPDSRKALDLLQRLEREASSAGGRVHTLIGNHEAMRLLNDFRYTTPGEYAAFATPDSEDIRRQVVEAAPPADRERLLQDMPLGMVEMATAFGPTGQYGSFIRRLNAVERINGVLFLHGGISPAVASLKCAEINARVRRDLSADLVKTRDKPETSLASLEAGPLWYRGLAEEPESFAPEVEAILAAQQARAIVIGHTVQVSGRMNVRFGGKVIVIDTGMQPQYVASGRASALEIQGGVFTAIYRDKREVIAGARAGGGS
jgi:hypothetical protein